MREPTCAVRVQCGGHHTGDGASAGRRPGVPVLAARPLTQQRWKLRHATDARASQLAEGLWCLRLPLHFVAPRSVNTYLIALADGYCLVDCGTSLEPGWEALEYALAEAGVRPDQLSLLVCTHMHADHAGLAAEVVARTGCELARGEGPESADHVLRDPRLPLADRRRLGLREGLPRSELDEWVDPAPEDDLDYPQVVADRILVPGDQIESAPGAWTVVPAPGHSPTQILLHNPARGWLIMADLAYDVGEPFFEYGRTSDPYADHLDSLDRALGLHARLGFPGHGRVVESPDHRLRVARAAAESSRNRVLHALSADPQSAYELAIKLLGPRKDPGERQSMISVALCVLEHLESRDLAAAEPDTDGVRRWRATS